MVYGNMSKLTPAEFAIYREKPVITWTFLSLIK